MRCLGITNVMARSIPDPFPLHPQGKKSADRAGSALPVLERQRNQPDIPDVARPPVFREIKAVLARDSSIGHTSARSASRIKGFRTCLPFVDPSIAEIAAVEVK
jgi:hypothetical protein